MSRQIYHHLKDEAYYNELYDRLTIDDCKRWEGLKEGETTKEKYKDNPAKGLVTDLGLYFKKGENYRNKSETIREWMARDRAYDEKIVNAIEPKGVRCLSCSTLMNATIKNLHTELDDKKNRVLFFFECPKCQKKRAYWEDGKEWESRPDLCPKCKTAMESSSNRKDNIITTTYFCPNCRYKEVDTMDLDEKKEEKIDPNFEADRKKYCISDKEGMEYITQSDRLKRLTEIMKDMGENKDVREAIAKIKKLTIAELQNELTPVVEQAGYTKFELEKPEITKDVIVGFSLQDNKPERNEYDSVHTLQRVIKKVLGYTNWRLMSDGISYRLGFLNGRLRGVEGEEALRELVEREVKKIKKQNEVV